MKEYKSISSKMYEQTKPIGYSIEGDLEYYYNQLKDVKGEILEAGVGTGRLLIPLIKKGLRLDGVDISPHMLDICRENCKKHSVETSLYLQDLVDLDINKKYDAIIMPTGSFCLIDGMDQIKKLLVSFENHLSKNGRIILDLIFPIDFEKGEEVYHTKIDDRTNIILYSYSREIDLVEQKTYSLNKYEKWQDDKLIDTEIAEFNLSWYGVNEFIYILKDLGFTNIGYDFGYGDDTNKSIITFIIGK